MTINKKTIVAASILLAIGSSAAYANTLPAGYHYSPAQGAAIQDPITPVSNNLDVVANYQLIERNRALIRSYTMKSILALGAKHNEETADLQAVSARLGTAVGQLTATSQRHDLDLNRLDSNVASNGNRIGTLEQTVGKTTAQTSMNLAALDTVVGSHGAEIGVLRVGLADQTARVDSNTGKLEKVIQYSDMLHGLAESNGDAINNLHSTVQDNSTAITANSGAIRTIADGTVTNTNTMRGMQLEVNANYTSINQLAAATNANAQGAGNNTKDIAANAHGISVNSQGVVTNANGIKNLVKADADLASGLHSITRATYVNGNSIVDNANAIQSNTNSITDNADNLAAVTGHIDQNSGNIRALTTSNQGNTAAIKSNTGKIDATASNVNSNSTLIAANRQGVEHQGKLIGELGILSISNHTEVVNLGAKTDALGKEIEGNTIAISDVSDNLRVVGKLVGDNMTDIGINTDAIGKLELRADSAAGNVTGQSLYGTEADKLAKADTIKVPVQKEVSKSDEMEDSVGAANTGKQGKVTPAQIKQLKGNAQIQRVVKGFNMDSTTTVKQGVTVVADRVLTAESNIQTNNANIVTVAKATDANTDNIKVNTGNIKVNATGIEKLVTFSNERAKTVNADISNLSSGVKNNSKRIDTLDTAFQQQAAETAENFKKVNNRIDGTQAMMHAVTNARPYVADGQTAVGVGMGYAGGSEALAVGAAHSFEGTNWSMSTTVNVLTFGGSTDFSAGVGAQYVIR